MAVYRFRVTFEDFDDTYRDIDIRSTQSFLQFHNTIQEAIGFDNSKPASFYMSNDNWKKGQEITFAKESGGAAAVLMSESRLCDYIADPHQKIYYMFDAPSQWNFFIELIRITGEDPSKKYPAVTRVNGEAPKQYLVIEPPKGIADPEFADDDLPVDAEEGEEQILDSGEEEDQDDTESVGFGEAVDEEEYDNIEERSEENSERDEF
ncbi:MAG TPA: hypothetical protein VFW78_02785 [Bacteroidia bacterium]|nr:hypothetical protein [Bacteroidia bacterium]